MKMFPAITRTRVSGVLDPLIFLIGIVILWQIAVTLKWVDNLVLPAPADVVVSFFELFGAGRIWRDIAATLWETTAGFIIAAVGGIVLAVVTGLSERMKIMLYPHIIALQVMPRIAIAP